MGYLVLSIPKMLAKQEAADAANVEAHAQGFRAAFNGVQRPLNPHRDSYVDLFESWNAGFDEYVQQQNDAARQHKGKGR